VHGAQRGQGVGQRRGGAVGVLLPVRRLGGDLLHEGNAGGHLRSGLAIGLAHVPGQRGDPVLQTLPALGLDARSFGGMALALGLHDKPAFFSKLDQLNIPHPEVSFSPPDSTGNWLVKPRQGQGGVGVQLYLPKDRVESAIYWQKYQAGTQHSVLFLADGQEAQIIGFNTQWTVSLSKSQEFIFSGIINSCALLSEQKERIANWLKKLVPVFALKGLNSLDFIQEGEKSIALEINPRPSASMQLYDADLLKRHMEASQGELTDCRLHSGYTGYQIVYAEQDVLIPEAFAWPDWCMDLPEFGAMCRKGQPICSIIAHQKRAQSVMNELLIKQLNLIKGFYPHGI
jgi:predicted ATP-grasp superfamily ATP-dependent carboligase